MSDQTQATTTEQAVATFIARRDRTEHPAGGFDKRRGWYPSDAEYRSCCRLIRMPSAAYPFSLMVHCRTADHVANLYGVDASEIRRAVRKARPAARLGGEYFKAVAQTEGGRLVSIFDGTTEYRLGETLVQRVRLGHQGGYYVHRTADGASGAVVPTTSVLADAPRVVIRVRAEGQYTTYRCLCNRCNDARLGYAAPVDHDKLAFSRVTPLEIVTTQEA